MNTVIKKITDVITIVGPAVIAVIGALELTGVLPMAEAIYQVIGIVLGAASGAASVIYNAVTKPKDAAAPAA